MDTIQILVPIIRQAGAMLLDYRAKGFDTQTKSAADDFVTTADLNSDKYIREEIGRLFPEDKILSEENGSRPDNYSGRVWMIDPLDGTRAYVDGSESFSVMIGLAIDGVPVLGITYAPVYDELYYGEKGRGSFVIKGGEAIKLHVSDVSDIKEARSVDYRRTENVRELDKLVDRIGLTIVAVEGTNTLKIGKVAQGIADVVINTNTRVSKWDFCAPQVILARWTEHHGSGKVEPCPCRPTSPRLPLRWPIRPGHAWSRC